MSVDFTPEVLVSRNGVCSRQIQRAGPCIRCTMGTGLYIWVGPTVKGW